MTKCEFFVAQREYALKWINTPVERLPDTLTHEKCYDLYHEAEDNLIEFLRYNPVLGIWFYSED